MHIFVNLKFVVCLFVCLSICLFVCVLASISPFMHLHLTIHTHACTPPRTHTHIPPIHPPHTPPPSGYKILEQARQQLASAGVDHHTGLHRPEVLEPPPLTPNTTIQQPAEILETGKKVEEWHADAENQVGMSIVQFIIYMVASCSLALSLWN